MVHHRDVRVPTALLLDRELSASAKLVWILLRLPGQTEPPNTTRLVADSGLSRPTVLRARALLEEAGWLASGKQGPATQTSGRWGRAVMLSTGLVTASYLSPEARVLHGALRLAPGFRDGSGQIRTAILCDLLGVSPHTGRRALRELVRSGWLEIRRANRSAPIHFTLTDPESPGTDAELARASRRLQAAEFHGEAIMREYLNLLVDSDAYEDDASPGFLVNPLTEERMELDRYYPGAAAFEYNGDQHYGATALYTAAQALKQRGRDYMKMGICLSKGIDLVVVHAEDLTLERMREKVGSRLPVRDLRGRERMVRFLERISRGYRRAVERGRSQALSAKQQGR